VVIVPASPDPPFASQPQGISLDELTQAFAQVMKREPREAGRADSAEPQPEGPGRPSDEPSGLDAAATVDASVALAANESAVEPSADDSCPICPRTILEAMLFVGDRNNQPLTPGRAAELMRDVEVDEVPTLVDELNRRYDESGAPYRIVGEADGYRLTLRPELRSLRSRFYGRIREARLSQAAIDVLALVAYQQPLTGEKVQRLRGKPSSRILSHLVRRGLLKIERPAEKPRTPRYHTTERFLQLFNLQSLDDLPRSEDTDAP
jgi:segregation and condensation protein B